MQSLNDWVVLVTSGGRGLGEAICYALADAGAQVIVGDARTALASEIASRIRAEGGQAYAMDLDVTDPDKSRRAVRMLMDEYGQLDALINSAGVNRTVSVEEMEVGDWDHILGTNLKGPFLLSREVFPHMKRQRRGHIVNIVSTATKRDWSNASAYHASKWGLLGFSQALHVEARPHKIKVTALVCDGMKTPFLFDRLPDMDKDALRDSRDVAQAVRSILAAPEGSVIPALMEFPMRDISWP